MLSSFFVGDLLDFVKREGEDFFFVEREIGKTDAPNAPVFVGRIGVGDLGKIHARRILRAVISVSRADGSVENAYRIEKMKERALGLGGARRFPYRTSVKGGAHEARGGGEIPRQTERPSTAREAGKGPSLLGGRRLRGAQSIVAQKVGLLHREGRIVGEDVVGVIVEQKPLASWLGDDGALSVGDHIV